MQTETPTVRYQKMQPPEVYQFLKSFEIVEGENEDEVIERLHVLLKNTTGIEYTYNGAYSFTISVETPRGPLSCNIIIYRNTGQYKKSHGNYWKAETKVFGDKPQFAIEVYDTTRYFSGIFTYITNNYSADVIAPFSSEDLNYGLYCPDYADDE
jgi:hypothetical protein